MINKVVVKVTERKIIMIYISEKVKITIKQFTFNVYHFYLYFDKIIRHGIRFYHVSKYTNPNFFSTTVNKKLKGKNKMKKKGK